MSFPSTSYLAFTLDLRLQYCHEQDNDLKFMIDSLNWRNCRPPPLRDKGLNVRPKLRLQSCHKPANGLIFMLNCRDWLNCRPHPLRDKGLSIRFMDGTGDIGKTNKQVKKIDSNLKRSTKKSTIRAFFYFVSHLVV
ncbi:uncharacterized protein LOC143858914 isoform X1 [Tasmannia lanceolata]|uniref:uncharacterized protein LOC143858914 isoform X1 n=1 Tax=Tasmannia lanceolata TaxID=3420 RepID=UPI0040638D92